MRSPEFPPGNHKTKGGHWKRKAMIKLTIQYYVILDPRNQARQLGGIVPYIKGMCAVEFQINAELNGSYGRPGKSFKNFF